ncbi:DoxX family protein [Nocardia sp. NBC_00511]|uniref:DoxX family protein n=1 Tax=Nocardia sp. NBC_00511 TaxID=2903591 RepID=UPI0030E33DD5
MSVQTVETATDPETGEPGAARSWNPIGRLLFRFAFLYFGLFCVFYPQPVFAFLGPVTNWLPDSWVLGYVTMSEPVVKWVGHTVFGVEASVHNTGSGDGMFFWVLVFTILVIAVAGTLVWSVLDRRRPRYDRLAAWFLFFIRLCLAGQMLGYGFAKLIPTQMPDPALTTLLTPFGDFAPMGVLWTQVGVSPVYEMLLGSAEVLGGVLLLLPRMQLAGVLLSMVAMAQVWVLNMTFDVPVKLLSFHLLLLSAVLLVPELPRLTAVLTGRAAGPAATPQPFHTRRAVRIAAVAQILLAVWMSAGDVWQGWDGWRTYGPGATKPELYGIWTVGEFTRDGQSLPPLLTDENRWQRVVFENPKAAVIQRMTSDFVPVGAEIDSGAHRLVLRLPESTTDLATFTYERPAPDRLVLTGELDGHPTTVTLDQVDLSKLPLRAGRGLHFIQENPNFGKVMGE